MLQNVIVTNYLGEELKLSMFNPAETGFYIKSIDGLGPSNANINVLDIVSQDGSVFNSARTEKRNIVLTVGPYNVADVESYRQKLYKMFPIKRKLKLNFETDNTKVYIYGFVESNEPDIWNKNVTHKISVICPYPYFMDLFENSITFSGDDNEHVISYDGDIETGLNIQINCGAAMTGLKITNKKGDYFAINDTYLKKIVSDGFKEGDIIKISTITNEKSIKLIRGETETNLLNAMDRNSKWFKIGKGNNTYTVSATTGLTDMFITMSSPILYEGI